MSIKWIHILLLVKLLLSDTYLKMTLFVIIIWLMKYFLLYLFTNMFFSVNYLGKGWMGSTSQKLLIYWKRRFRGIDVWVFNQKGQSTLEKKWQGKEVYVLILYTRASIPVPGILGNNFIPVSREWDVLFPGNFSNVKRWKFPIFTPTFWCKLTNHFKSKDLICKNIELLHAA